MTFDDWCAAHGDYLNDSDDAAKAARLMARRAWDAAVERCAKIADEHARRDYPWGSERQLKRRPQAVRLKR